MSYENRKRPEQFYKIIFRAGYSLFVDYYSKPSLERQHLFPKMLPLKQICCCLESLVDIMICKKVIVLSLFLHRTNVLDIC